MRLEAPVELKLYKWAVGHPQNRERHLETGPEFPGDDGILLRVELKAARCGSSQWLDWWRL